MGIQIDLIVPPIIVGLLIIMIFRINAFVMETSADNRLSNDVQTFAEVAATVLQEELRLLDHFTAEVRPDSIGYISFNGDSVFITRADRNIEIARYQLATADYDTVTIPANLTNLQFTLEPQASPTPTFLRIRVEAESRPQQHVRFRNDEQTVRAFAERRLFLRNVAVQANQ